MFSEKKLLKSKIAMRILSMFIGCAMLPILMLAAVTYYNTNNFFHSTSQIVKAFHILKRFCCPLGHIFYTLIIFSIFYTSIKKCFYIFIWPKVPAIVADPDVIYHFLQKNAHHIVQKVWLIVCLIVGKDLVCPIGQLNHLIRRDHLRY